MVQTNYNHFKYFLNLSSIAFQLGAVQENFHTTIMPLAPITVLGAEGI